MVQRIGWLIVVAGSSFLGGMAALVLTARSEHAAWAQPPARDANPPLVTDLVVLSDRFELVAKRVGPAVVYVEAVKPSDKPSSSHRVTEESGSGVITRLEGRREHFVFTNNH